MNSSGNIEYEQLGMVALIGLVLFPGIVWITKAKGPGSLILRSTVVSGLLLGAVVLEASMDDTANSLVESL